MKHTIILILAFLFITGCSEKHQKQPSEKEQTTSVVDPAKLKSVEFKTKGMDCSGCEETIKKRVKKVNGVYDVTSDYKTNTTKVTYEPDKTNPKEIEEAIVDAGYKVLETKQ